MYKFKLFEIAQSRLLRCQRGIVFSRQASSSTTEAEECLKLTRRIKCPGASGVPLWTTLGLFVWLSLKHIWVLLAWGTRSIADRGWKGRLCKSATLLVNISVLKNIPRLPALFTVNILSRLLLFWYFCSVAVGFRRPLAENSECMLWPGGDCSSCSTVELRGKRLQCPYYRVAGIIQ